MKKLHTISPEGTKDILFSECLKRSAVQKKINKVYESRAFNEVVTPGIEYFDLFSDEISQAQMYTTTDNKGRLVVFRPDTTLPIARLTAARLQKFSRPIRLYYNQNIYRKRPEHSGKGIETIQSGVEILGADGIRSDLEVINTAVQAISSCVDNFRIELGHAGFFKKIADGFGVSYDVKEQIREIIESKNYAALNDILENIENSPYKEAMAKLPRLFGTEEVFEVARKCCLDDETKETLEYIHKLYKALCEIGLKDKIMLDFALVQRNDYYTGIVFSAYIEGVGDAVLNGGRYNNLFDKFNMNMPAVGFALNIDELTLANGVEAVKKESVKGLIYGELGYESKAQILLNELTKNGDKYEIALFDSIEENIKYAKSTKIQQLIIVSDKTVYKNIGGDDNEGA